MNNLLVILGIWLLISIIASLLIARFLSATNPDGRANSTHTTAAVPNPENTARPVTGTLPGQLLNDDTRPSHQT